MVLQLILAALAVLSVLLTLWQWLVARKFPLHQRVNDRSFAPGVTVLKPLKGCDSETEACLKSWLTQDYSGPMQLLFGVAAESDPVCEIVNRLIREHPNADAQLVMCPDSHGANAKVSKLTQLQPHVRHETVVITDADTRVPPDFLTNVLAPLRDPQVGLVNCFYRLANPTTLAMQWEAIAINADFWSQVLQSRSLKPLDFALGAVMATRRKQLDEIGGFAPLVDCLADDYQLGHRIAANGHRIELSPMVVDCFDPPMTWRDAWKHQLRWVRTIRVCQPAPYFFSIISNATLWPLLWLAIQPSLNVLIATSAFLLVRIATAISNQRKLKPDSRPGRFAWLVPMKDLLQVALWIASFAGNRIEWRGERYRLHRDGTLVRN